MKKIAFILSVSFCSFSIQSATAQESVTTLEHNGTTQVFYGDNSFSYAYDASVNGDQIYLSGGSFTPPRSIVKGVKIYGNGISPSVGKQTIITADFYINKGSDSLRLEGLSFNGDILYDGSCSINSVKIIRCQLTSVYFKSTSATSEKNNCSIEECYVSGSIAFYNYGNNFLLRNSIISGGVSMINANALIEGNIFLINNLTNATFCAFSLIKNSKIQNNICLAEKNLFSAYASTGNDIKNNIFMTSVPLGNSVSGNYSGVVRSEIFINQSGDTINYEHDYHLKNPEKYIGTDGLQIGIYGGLSFNNFGVLSNPSVVSKSVARSTDADGNLLINISVNAHNN